MNADEIREAVAAKGTTLYRLARAHGLNRNALVTSLNSKRRLPTYHLVIARFLGLPLHQLWPQHYGPEGYRDRRGDRARRMAHPPAAYEALLARIEAGEIYSRIKRELGVPSENALYPYMRRNPSFSARWRRAMGSRPGTRASHYSDAQVTAVLARVERGERLTDIYREPGQPSDTVILNRRRRDPAIDAAFRDALEGRGGGRVGPARLDRVLDGMREGRAYYSMRDVVTPNTLIRLRRTDPTFAARFDEARQSGRAIVVRQAETRKVSHAEMWAIVEAAVRRVPPYARNDIRADLMVELLEGRVAPEDARAAAGRLEKAWNQMFGRWDLSMDQERGEGGLNLHGLLASDEAGRRVESYAGAE